jgi:hypothetical protein
LLRRAVAGAVAYLAPEMDGKQQSQRGGCVLSVL